MLGDHFTKPLQGGMFRKFRADIQCIPADSPDSDLRRDRDELKAENTPASSTNSSPQECVGKAQNPVKDFTGYRRTNIRRGRREGEGRLAPSLLAVMHSRKRVSYADAMVERCKGGCGQHGVKEGVKKARVNTPITYS
jgi:hypothetical protein